MADGIHQHSDIEAAVDQTLLQAGAGFDRPFRPQQREFFGQSRDDPRQAGDSEALGDSKAQRPADLGNQRRGVKLAVSGKHELCVPEKSMAVAREAHAAPRTFQHGRGYRRLQLAQPKRQRRLRDVQPVRRFLDRAELGGPIERLKLGYRNTIHQ